MNKPLNHTLPRLLGLAAILIVALAGNALAAKYDKEDQEDTSVAAKSQGKGWLGITMQDLNDNLAEALDIEDGRGVLIESVIEDSPADDAGLRDGDVIISFDGQSIDDVKDLSRAVGKTAPGDEVKITVIRNGRERDLVAEIGTRKESPSVYAFRDGKNFRWTDKEGDMHDLMKIHLNDRGYLGVRLQDLSPQLGEYFGVEDGHGALISEVLEDTPAEAAGLRAGDVIVKVGDEEIEDSGDVHEALADTEEGDVVTVAVVRKLRTRSFEVTLAENPHELAWFSPGNDVQVRMLREHPDLEALHRDLGDMDEDELEELKDELQDLKAELRELKRELNRERD